MSDEPQRESVTGRRLAAIITAAAARLPQGERMLLWLECYRLMGDTLDAATHPELCAAINALRDPVPGETQASQWN